VNMHTVFRVSFLYLNFIFFISLFLDILLGDKQNMEQTEIMICTAMQCSFVVRCYCFGET